MAAASPYRPYLFRTRTAHQSDRADGCNTMAHSTARRCASSCRASMPTWCAGSARNTNGCEPRRRPSSAGGESQNGILACSRTGYGFPRLRGSGEQDDKSPVTGDCHAGICGSRRVRFPPATRPARHPGPGPRGLRRGRPPVPARPRHQRAARRPGRHGHHL